MPSKHRPRQAQTKERTALREAWVRLAEMAEMAECGGFLCNTLTRGDFSDFEKSAMTAQIRADLCEHWNTAYGAACCQWCGGRNSETYDSRQMRVLYCLLQAEMLRPSGQGGRRQ